MQTSPQEQKRIQKQVAYECAISLFDHIPDDKIGKGHDLLIAEVFQKWIEAKGTDINSSITASKALREAVRAYRYPVLITPAESKKAMLSVLIKADEIFEWFNK